MAQVTVVINAREYAIACEDGQERRIMELSRILEEKAQMLKSISGQINENMLLAMIGILIADDLTEARKNSAPLIVDDESELTDRLENIKKAIIGVANELDML